MAWQALKLSPFYKNADKDARSSTVTTLLEIFNERLRSVLWNNHKLKKDDFAQEYCVGTDHFLTYDMQMEDSAFVGRSWPLEKNTASKGYGQVNATDSDMGDFSEDQDNDSPSGTA